MRCNPQKTGRGPRLMCVGFFGADGLLRGTNGGKGIPPRRWRRRSDTDPPPPSPANATILPVPPCGGRWRGGRPGRWDGVKVGYGLHHGLMPAGWRGKVRVTRL